METEDSKKSYVGLSHREVAALVRGSSDRIERMMRMLATLENDGEVLTDTFCKVYDLLLCERVNTLIRLHEYYCGMVGHSCWLIRPLVRRRARRVGKMHKKALHVLLMLRTYMRVHEF